MKYINIAKHWHTFNTNYVFWTYKIKRSTQNKQFKYHSQSRESNPGPLAPKLKRYPQDLRDN